jgi:hypothetical protein
LWNVAHIPGDLVLVPANMQGTYPCLFHDRNFDEKKDDAGEDTFSWQSILTSYCFKALKGRYSQNNRSSDNFPRWKQWIRSWNGSASSKDGTKHGAGPEIPRPIQYYTSEHIERLARLSHCNTLQVQEAIQTKYKIFENDWNNVKSFLLGDDSNEEERVKLKEEFGELYSLVLSRTANLGPEWGNQMGIIPLHDMINHPPRGQEANVELFCLGDIRSAIGNENLKMILRPLLTENHLRGIEDPPTFLDQDFVIAARKRIDPNEELFLSYKSGIGEMSEREQIWLFLQYGFPFRP